MNHDLAFLAARKAYAGDAVARIAQFLPLVRRLAWYYSASCGPALDVDDLQQAGLIALTECAQRHDRASDDGFAAYAKTRVRGAMIDLLRQHSQRPRGAAAAGRRIEAAEAALRTRLLREPDEAEIAAALGLSVAALGQLRGRLVAASCSLNDCDIDRDAAFASPEPDAEIQLLRHEDRTQLAAAVAQLPERLQLVVKLHFVEELNLTEIAAVLDVSVPRVHQLKTAALGKLRLALVPAECP